MQKRRVHISWGSAFIWDEQLWLESNGTGVWMAKRVARMTLRKAIGDPLVINE